MPFRLPVFNLTSNIWHNALPADISDGLFLPPAGPADLSPICQLYLSKYGAGGWFHAWPDDIRIALERAGYITLRVPLDTDVRCPRWPYHGITWHDLDLVECPAGSRRWYVVVMVEQAHMGFANEYRIAILAQIGPVGPTVQAGTGTGTDVGLGTGGPLTIQAGMGTGTDVGTGAAAGVIVQAGTGTGSAVVASITGLPSDGGGGSDIGVGGGGINADSGSGTGSDVTAVPGGAIKVEAGSGTGSDVTADAAGPALPAPDCAHATHTSLPLNYTGNILSGTSDWWRFDGTGGTTYHIQITLNSGSLGSGHLLTGACGSTTDQAVTLSPSWTRQSFTLGSTQQCLIRVDADIIGSGNYTINVGTGP